MLHPTKAFLLLRLGVALEKLRFTRLAREFTRCVRHMRWDNADRHGGPMPNYKRRKKKAGRNKWKKLRAMRLSVEARRAGQERSVQRGPFRKGLADQPDRQLFKPGSANDLYSRKAA